MLTPSKYSEIESLALRPESEKEAVLNSLSFDEANAILYSWEAHARANQRLPDGVWRFWLILAGRGFGKTRTGGETVRKWSHQYKRIHLIGPTASDTRNVMVQGPSGLLSCFPPHERPEYSPAKHMIRFQTGAIAEIFSADEPERLRGPQCEAFWADEPCAWRFLTDAWDNLMFGFRLGDDPRGVITTTPKPSKWLRELMSNPSTHVTRGSTYDNRAWLAQAFFANILSKYEGTRLGRQEINAEVLEDVPGALWTQKLIDATRVPLAQMHWELVTQVVIGVDPAVSAKEDSDETGIVVVAMLQSRHLIVLDDLSLKGSPIEWARVIQASCGYRKVDIVIGEVNNGGDLVERNLHALDESIPFRAVRASHGKYTRAQPVATLYERGRVHHLGSFPTLEEQMCSFVPGADKSPDRMDALVWAIWHLVIEPEERTGAIQVGSWERIEP